MFLAETGSARDKGELKYRLSLRAAFFVEHPDLKPQDVFGLMRRAYDVRSVVAHGGTPDSRDYRAADGSILTPTEFADVVEDIIRSALIRAIREAADDRFPPAWEDGLILPREQ